MVAILGCGPAGLMAMHACVRAGFDPVIYSKKVPSKIFAAMFLHKFIPDICPDTPELDIKIIKAGTREGYAENVYGRSTMPVSWDKFHNGNIMAWNLGSAYDNLWDLYSHRIRSIDLQQKELKYIENKYDLVISTIPRTLLCTEEHAFISQRIWVRHGKEGMIPNVNDDDVMYYNGYTPDGRYGKIGPPWYRYSQINGYRSWEYSKPPMDIKPFQISEGYKPLWTNCNCYPKFIKLGRFGAWEKQILTHHVYGGTFSALQRMLRSD